MDPTITLSEGFPHLSVGDPNTQKEAISRDPIPTLTRVSRKRDSFTDDGHKTLDTTVMKIFGLYKTRLTSA